MLEGRRRIPTTSSTGCRLLVFFRMMSPYGYDPVETRATAPALGMWYQTVTETNVSVAGTCQNRVWMPEMTGAAVPLGDDVYKAPRMKAAETG